MLKRIFMVFLSVIIAMSVCNYALADDASKVEIEFCIGDDTLKINGEAVTVERPYAVGAGVTLVPVRVITEAFGAKVGWINETQTATLTYPDVDIVLQIGNIIAEVNGKAETLLAAPEISGGSTMVPLRFISENFGADVSYDNDTGRITVVKEISTDDDLKLSGMTECNFIGDSFYGWTMEKPSDMNLETRYFDGSYTLFSDDNGNFIEINISCIDKEHKIEEAFNQVKSYVEGGTLVKADKDFSDKNCKWFHIQSKNKEEIADIYEFVTDKYIFGVSGFFTPDDVERKENGVRVLSTFITKYEDTSDIYNLSNVNNGVRRFESKTMNYSFAVPDYFLMMNDEESENDLYFVSSHADDNDSHISFIIYSKDSVQSAEALANNDFEHNRNYFNEQISRFDDVISKREYGNIEAYEYNVEVNATLSDYIQKDVFFELGDYVYNMCISIKLPNDNAEQIIKTILESLEFSEIDFAKVGTILNDNYDSEGKIKSDDLNKCTFELPDTFYEVEASKTGVAYSGMSCYFVATILANEEYTYRELRDTVKSLEKAQSKISGCTITHATSDVTLGSTKYVKMAYENIEDESVVYYETYYTVYDGMIYGFQATYPEIAYSNKARKEIEEILKTVKFK